MMKTWTTRILLTFVIFSIGFAAGKHSVRRNVAATVLPEADSAATGADADTPAEKLRVHYLHATFRCVTCNTIEKMTRELLGSQFAAALGDGRIEWVEADFQENETLARRFDVVASCVVVARMRGETVLDYQRLDGVWTLLGKPDQFNAYVGDAIRGYLAELEERNAQ